MNKELDQINYSVNSPESIARCIYIGALAEYDANGLHNDMEGILQDYLVNIFLTSDDLDISLENIELVKEKYDLGTEKLRQIKREVTRNTAYGLINNEIDQRIIDLNLLLTKNRDACQISSVNIINDDLWFDEEIDYIFHIIEHPLSELEDQYDDIEEIKTFIEENEITKDDIVDAYKAYATYDNYFKECFDLITDFELKNLILARIADLNYNTLSLVITKMGMYEEYIPFEIPSFMDENRLKKSIFEIFNLKKAENYWGMHESYSVFSDEDAFDLDIDAQSQDVESAYDFIKLKPDLEIASNSPTAIWHQAILHAFCTGEFNETQNLLLVNTMKITLGTTASINSVEVDDFSEYSEQYGEELNLLLELITEKFSNLTSLTDIELWDAYLEASDKITDPTLRNFTLAVCSWIAQETETELQNIGMGKLIKMWNAYANEEQQEWYEEILAYANGEKG